MYPTDFVRGEEFWCSCCDINKVHSDKPETGQFFSQFGHEWDHKAQRCADTYTQVIYAYCPECIKKLGIDLEKMVAFYADYARQNALMQMQMLSHSKKGGSQ